jgi:hypothetical protein
MNRAVEDLKQRASAHDPALFHRKIPATAYLDHSSFAATQFDPFRIRKKKSKKAR